MDSSVLSRIEGAGGDISKVIKIDIRGGFRVAVIGVMRCFVQIGLRHKLGVQNILNLKKQEII